MQEKLPANSTVFRQIYGVGGNRTTFVHLKQRVKNDLMTILMLQDTERHSRSAYRQAEIESRKLILQGDILLKKGIYLPAIKALEKASKLAEKYELVNEKLQVDDLLRTHLGFKKGEKVYHSYDKSVEKSLLLLQALMETRTLYHSVLLPNMFNRSVGDDYIEKCRRAYEVMRKNYKATGSPNISYFMYLTGLYYYTFTGEWKQALSQAALLLNLVKAEEAISSGVRLANAHLQLASLQMKLYRFSQAIPNAREAARIFKGGAMNELVSLEQLFLASFNAGDRELYEDVLGRAFAHPKIHSSEVLYGKWMFYKAASLFVAKKWTEAFNTLNADSTLLKDKSGWVFGHRLLEIMILMEREQFELMEFRIEALRKLLQRQKHKEVTRIKTIFRLLHDFWRSESHYVLTMEQNTDLMELLKTGEGDYYWDPQGYEIIRFDKWFSEKLKKGRL